MDEWSHPTGNWAVITYPCPNRMRFLIVIICFSSSSNKVRWSWTSWLLRDEWPMSTLITSGLRGRWVANQAEFTCWLVITAMKSQAHFLIKMWWSWDHLIFVMGSALLLKYHLYIKMGPWQSVIFKLLMHKKRSPAGTELPFNVRGPSYLGFTWSLTWLLMPWLLASPGHQQPCYWLYYIE